MRQYTFAGKYKKYVMGSVMCALFSLSLGSYACQANGELCTSRDDCCEGSVCVVVHDHDLPICVKQSDQSVESSGVDAKKKAQEAVRQRPLDERAPDVNLPNTRH